MKDNTNEKPATKRIVILGGGFGGVYAALHLEKLLARKRDVEVCLISRDNFFLFTPMLHEIAASDLEITNIVNPLRKLLRRTQSIPMPASTLVWTAGTVPNPLVSSLPCKKQCDRVLVNEFLQVPDWPGVWAVGDCGFVPDTRQPGRARFCSNSLWHMTRGLQRGGRQAAGRLPNPNRRAQRRRTQSKARRMGIRSSYQQQYCYDYDA